MFIPCASRAKALGGRVVVLAQPPLADLIGTLSGGGSGRRPRRSSSPVRLPAAPALPSQGVPDSPGFHSRQVPMRMVSPSVFRTGSGLPGCCIRRADKGRLCLGRACGPRQRCEPGPFPRVYWRPWPPCRGSHGTVSSARLWMRRPRVRLPSPSAEQFLGHSLRLSGMDLVVTVDTAWPMRPEPWAFRPCSCCPSTPIGAGCWSARTTPEY